jgi:hypothetical protein
MRLLEKIIHNTLSKEPFIPLSDFRGSNIFH